MKLQAFLLVAAINGNSTRGRGGGRGQEREGWNGAGWGRTPIRRPPLGPNQCAICRKEGHWKKGVLLNRGGMDQGTRETQILHLEDVDEDWRGLGEEDTKLEVSPADPLVPARLRN